MANDIYKSIQSIIQGLYGISESEKMIPKENARFTLYKTIECLENALKQYEQEIKNKTIDDFAERVKVDIDASYYELFLIDELVEKMKEEQQSDMER